MARAKVHIPPAARATRPPACPARHPHRAPRPAAPPCPRQSAPRTPERTHTAPPVARRRLAPTYAYQDVHYPRLGSDACLVADTASAASEHGHVMVPSFALCGEEGERLPRWRHGVSCQGQAQGVRERGHTVSRLAACCGHTAAVSSTMMTAASAPSTTPRSFTCRCRLSACGRRPHSVTPANAGQPVCPERLQDARKILEKRQGAGQPRAVHARGSRDTLCLCRRACSADATSAAAGAARLREDALGK